MLKRIIQPCNHILFRSRLLPSKILKLHIDLILQKYNMSAALDAIPKVDIDSDGIFKYILIRVYDKEVKDEPSIVILRGYKRAPYHTDIYEEVQEKLHPLDCDTLGGGRISHDLSKKSIHIYGYSQGFGKADHELAAEMLKKVYPEFKITISDEGY